MFSTDPLRRMLSRHDTKKIIIIKLYAITHTVMCVNKRNKFYIFIIKNNNNTKSCFPILYSIHICIHIHNRQSILLYIAQREQNAINFIIFIEIVVDVNLRLKLLVV